MEWVKDTFPNRATKGISPAETNRLNEQGDERVNTIGQGQEDYDNDFRPMVNVYDIWLPQENLLVTLPVDSADALIPLSVVEWDGPEYGPYYRLAFSDVPGNTMPLPPAAMWRDLHDLANTLFVKWGRQAEDQKKVLGYHGGADMDAQRIVEAGDNEAIKMDDPNKAREYAFGGVDSTTLAFFLQVKDLFFTVPGGNLDALGGLSAQSRPLGQDELLSAQASQRISEMKDRTMIYWRDVISSLAWYEWSDPLRERKLEKTVTGVPGSIPVNWTPETREGDFSDYSIDIDPYSLEVQSPGQKIQNIVNVFNQFIAPFGEQMQAQGIGIDFEALIRIIGNYSNLPELSEILTSAPTDDISSAAGSSPQPASTTRNYVRENRPAATRAGKDDVLSRILMGGQAQESEMATLGRPVS